MNIQLIQGAFSPNDALDLITKMIHIKITYHENKIALNANEEDIKYRESKIKNLQKELFEFKNAIADKKGNIQLHGIITVDA